MANVSRVQGLRPVRHLDGSPWNGQLTKYFVAASNAVALFNGDLVTLDSTTDAAGVPGIRKFVIGTDAAAVGVVVGFAINPLNLNSPQFRAASTATYVFVADAPDTMYEVQSQIVISDFNQNAVLTDAGGSTVTGQSGESISAVNTTATSILKLMGASVKVDNDITSVNAKVLVMINNHQFSGGTGTAGV